MGNLYEDIVKDKQSILEDVTGASVPALITSLEGTVYGTLDPLDIDNQIRGFMKDHYTQVDSETGVPQAGANSSITFSLKTLLTREVIDSTIEPDLEDFSIAWLDPTSGDRRDLLVDRILPTRSLSEIVLILGELDIEEE